MAWQRRWAFDRTHSSHVLYHLANISMVHWLDDDAEEDALYSCSQSLPNEVGGSEKESGLCGVVSLSGSHKNLLLSGSDNLGDYSCWLCSLIQTHTGISMIIKFMRNCCVNAPALPKIDNDNWVALNFTITTFVSFALRIEGDNFVAALRKSCGRSE